MNVNWRTTPFQVVRAPTPEEVRRHSIMDKFNRPRHPGCSKAPEGDEGGPEALSRPIEAPGRWPKPSAPPPPHSTDLSTAPFSSTATARVPPTPRSRTPLVATIQVDHRNWNTALVTCALGNETRLATLRSFQKAPHSCCPLLTELLAVALKMARWRPSTSADVWVSTARGRAHRVDGRVFFAYDNTLSESFSGSGQFGSLTSRRWAIRARIDNAVFEWIVLDENQSLHFRAHCSHFLGNLPFAWPGTHQSASYDHDSMSASKEARSTS